MSGKNESTKAVQKMFHAYWHKMHPNEFSAEQFYWFAWTPEQRKAMEFLYDEDDTNLFNTSYKLPIRCDSLWNKRDFIRHPTLDMRFKDNSWPFPARRITDEDITDSVLRSKLLTWTVKACRYQHMHRLIKDYANEMFYGYGAIPDEDGRTGRRHGGVNTPGQMFRIWPEFASLAEPKYRQRIAGQKLKSAMPPRITDEYIEQFQDYPYMKEINQILLSLTVLNLPIETDRYYPL